MYIELVFEGQQKMYYMYIEKIKWIKNVYRKDRENIKRTKLKKNRQSKTNEFF